ncbi:DUF4386 domain-containing protein [Sphingobium sp. JS3065]|uniref:DUF4386 family protein n=1 Tax=Sphingobium sp. JS3065 TaxID=2970925 RepID=UPI0022646B9D|nr:DUF4386 family protein [Sphingobium sp. JS3065]UZW57037.1 DUF4386 domain-containing protein [Sphingobium sp. JS3065]
MIDKQVLKLCIWSGPIGILIFFIGIFPLAHLFPPPLNPSDPLQTVVDFYAQHRLGILFGCMLIIWASGLMIPFMVAIFSQLRRIERGFPLLSSVFLFCAGIVIMEIVIPAWTFSAVALRESRPPEITLALSDLSMLMFIWPNPQTIMMMGAVGYAILRDPSPKPLFPRWLGYVNIAAGLLFTGSTFANIAYSGPFAWKGLMAFWMPAIDFGNWFGLMVFALLGTLKRDDYEATRRDNS